MRGITVAAVVLLVLAGIATGFGLRPEASTPSPAPGITDAAITEAATRAVQARLPQRQEPLWDQLSLFRFGPEDERALCGRFRTAPEAAPQEFVARILLPRTQARRATGEGARLLVVMEAGPGVQLASYNATGRYCREAGEPDPVQQVAADSSRHASGAPEAAKPAESSPPPMPQAVVRSPARLRESGHGSAAVLRIAQQGEAFRVFAFGPGGWLQVGDDAPRGWIHGSLLEVRR